MSDAPADKKPLRLPVSLRAHAADIENQGWPAPLSQVLRHAAEHIEWLEAVTKEKPVHGEGPTSEVKAMAEKPSVEDENAAARIPPRLFTKPK